ncbi:RNA polymerase sigma factor [Polaribacter vadi]|uniref:RNA polymerase sigma factor n=1 Tax=Polaribacter TaxID=52959 RepID=UPI001C080811|nr:MULTISPECIES: RNA polymerase sigma factor [Polaribacter]MBU3011605.1 RNA polymerase sigma factor [Polaribacter vadi]MDO6741418.1 RNA polymerase sigma factor [Polaribacter sp. 1_MG-2023]
MTKQDFKLQVFSLSERLFPMVARLLGSNSKAEDAIQEIMLKLWQKRKKIENHPNINGFVILTARNYCIDLLRKKTLVLEDSTSELKVLKSTSDIENLEWKELNNIIFKILEQLPKQQKEVFLMRDVDGYEFTEIAAALSLKIEHVRVLLSRARKQIGIALEKNYDYERGTY